METQHFVWFFATLHFESGKSTGWVRFGPTMTIRTRLGPGRVSRRTPSPGPDQPDSESGAVRSETVTVRPSHCVVTIWNLIPVGKFSCFSIYQGYPTELYHISHWVIPAELYHRYPFMPPTSTEIYHVQITQFELYHVYPKLAPTGQKIYQV